MIMKKVMFFVSVLAFGGAFAISAHTMSAYSGVVSIQEEREKIKKEELPEPVKTTLNGDEYKGWLISAAYRIKSKDTYEVELKKGAEAKTIRFDKEGRVIV